MKRRAFIQGVGSTAAMAGFSQNISSSNAKAKRVVFILLAGGAPHLDLFDYKPELKKMHGKVAPKYMWEGKQFAFMQNNPTILASPFKFKRHGKSGMIFSELLPNIASNADDICKINSMVTDQFNHGPAQAFLLTGSPFAGRPSLGSWVDYALGSTNENLPSFVTMVPGSGPSGGKALWNNGFLPGKHQGVQFSVKKNDAVFYLNNPEGVSPVNRQDSIEGLTKLNDIHYKKTGDKSIKTSNYSYKLALKMQTSIPRVVNLKEEPTKIKELYGKGPFAKSCLMTRRLLEKGTRFVQINYRGPDKTKGHSMWDMHGDVRGQSISKDLPILCRDIDQGISALIKDLKQRSMLNDTLIVVTTEFGRTCMRQNLAGKKTKNLGRDHWPNVYSTLLVGGGIKGGLTYGQSDDFGYEVDQSTKVHVHDLQATILHTLGIDHTKLTYRYQGRDFRLTDVHGKIIKDILT